MDELLKKRLIGAAVLLLGALLLTSLLPQPSEEPPLEAGWKRIVLKPGEPLQITPPAEAPIETTPTTAKEPEPLSAILPQETAVAATEPEPAAAPAQESDPPPVVTPDPRPEPEASPLPKKEPKPESKPVPPADSSKSWFVQLGSFSDIANARQLLQKFEPMGFKGVIAPIESTKGTLYRVRLGPFKDRAGAEAALAHVAGQGLNEAQLAQD